MIYRDIGVTSRGEIRLQPNDNADSDKYSTGKRRAFPIVGDKHRMIGDLSPGTSPNVRCCASRIKGFNHALVCDDHWGSRILTQKMY